MTGDKKPKLSLTIILIVLMCFLLMFFGLTLASLLADDPAIIAAINDLEVYCNDSMYVCCDMESDICQFSFQKTAHLDDFSFENYEKLGKYDFLEGLLNTNNGYYYMIRERQSNCYYICKTTDYKSGAIIVSVEDDYRFSVSGFDNYGYFVTKDKVYEFDFLKEKMVCLPNSDDWCCFLLNNSPKICQQKYMEGLGIERGNCTHKQNLVSFNYLGSSIYLNENEISDCAFTKAVFEHNFSPDFHISYPSGITSIFYRKGSFFSKELHFVVNYDRNNKQIIGYQMFELFLSSSDMLVYLPLIF